MTTSIQSYDASTSILSVGGVESMRLSAGGISAASFNGGQLAGMRNKIINGKMEVAQRGTTFAAANGYTLDRWTLGQGSSGVITVSQQADAPSSNQLQSSLRCTVTTADAAVAAADTCALYQIIEGYNVRDLIGTTFTLRFWVRSSKTGVHCVSFRNSGTDRSYITEYTVNAADTWEEKSVSVPGGLITAGTWNWTSGAGLMVGWALMSGSTFAAAQEAWQSGNFIATANQVNCLDTIGNIFAITGAQLEPGSVATAFEHRPYGMELSLCHRYAQVVEGSFAGVASSATVGEVAVPLFTAMRTAPSAMTNVVNGTWINGLSAGAATGATLSTSFLSGPQRVGFTTAAGMAAGNAICLIGQKVLFSAEL